MKKLLALALALSLAAQADARALFLTASPTGSTQVTGLSRISEVAIGTANTLGGAFDVRDICDAPTGATDALRRGVWYPNGVGGDSLLYNLVVILGDDKGGYAGNKTATSAATGAGGFATLRAGGGNTFQWLRPGMIVTGNAITGSAVIVGIDSLFNKLYVKGTVAYSASFTLSWRTPIRPDSLTLTATYPKVTILRFGQFMGITGGWTTATNCSTGATQTTTYSVAEDSTRSVYDVGNHYRSWKARQWYTMSGTRDPRGWRPLLGSTVTRAGAGGDPAIYDFVDPAYAAAAFSADPDTAVVWAVMNWGADGSPIGGDAKPNVYACLSYVNGTNNIDPGTLLTAFAFADSVSGGALFGQSEKLPRKMAFHIDDGWKRGDSRFNVAGAYGGIGVDDTTAFKASIDSLASLAIPFVVGVEVDSLDSVLLRTESVVPVTWSGTSMVSAGGFSTVAVGDYVDGPGADPANSAVTVTAWNSASSITVSASGSQIAQSYKFHRLGSGALYDKRWWARAPLARYTPHAHAGLTSSTSRAQNTGTIGAAYTGKFLRVLDVWGLSRTRYAFGSTDSAVAGLGTDHHNDIADTSATYWLNKRAFALLDSTFGKKNVDRLVMPPGDDWTNFQVKHTRRRQHGLGVDSIMAAAVLSGATGIRMNAGINVFGNDDSTTTNNYGWWVTSRTKNIGLAAGAAGSPSWLPAHAYGRPCHMVTTDGYPANSSQDSWSYGRSSYGGEKFLSGLLFEHVNLAADPTISGRGVFVLASHASDFGSSGDSGYQTRPMFYTFKYVTNAVRTANAFAYGGRKLVDFAYPDEIRP